jgi:hypothetical protein
MTHVLAVSVSNVCIVKKSLLLRLFFVSICARRSISKLLQTIDYTTGFMSSISLNLEKIGKTLKMTATRVMKTAATSK